MPRAEIRETIAAPADPTGACVVQVQISDAPLLEERTAEIRMLIRAKLPAYEGALLAQLQRETMVIARDTISSLLQDLATEIQQAGHQLRPTLKP